MRGLLFAIALSSIVSCSGSTPASLGLDQPLRVKTARAQFFSGDLPHDQGGPKLLTLESQNNKIGAGLVGKTINGNADKGSFAVALRFSDLGSGYWIVPVEELDPLTDGQVTWRAELEITADVPTGKHPLWLSAIDGEGHSGPLYTQDLEITSSLPKGHVVFSLQWDSQADLDLVVFTPEGKTVDPKHTTTGIDLDAGVTPSIGVMDRDSNASCVRDGYNQENLVFAGDPPHGVYQVGATMFNGCGASAATYTITVYVDGTEVRSASGRFVEPYDVSGGTKPVAPILKIEL